MERIVVNDQLLKFIAFIDRIFAEGKRDREFRNEVNLQALRSALFGAIEDMLRDKLYAERLNFLANYSDDDIMNVTKLLFKTASETTY